MVTVEEGWEGEVSRARLRASSSPLASDAGALTVVEGSEEEPSTVAEAAVAPSS